MLVEELMSTDVVTVPKGATLQDAAEQLLANGVGSVIVVDDETPIGILTETDLIRAGYETEQSFADVGVSQVGHRPVVSAAPDETVSKVAKKMAREDVKKVPVMADIDLVGIITLTDIVWGLSDIRKEASDLEAAREKWDPND
jgi:CBS domain-containing protein